MVCWPSRTSIPSFCSSNSIGGSTTSRPSGMSPTPSASSSDLISRAASRKELAVAADRAAQAEQPRAAVIVMQPGRVQAVMLRGRAEVPDVGVAVAGEQRIARQLVARPFADDGAGGVADVVLVEAQQRAEARVRQRGARAREAVIVQAAEVDAFLEVDLRCDRAPAAAGSQLCCGSMSSGRMMVGSRVVRASELSPACGSVPCIVQRFANALS